LKLAIRRKLSSNRKGALSIFVGTAVGQVVALLAAPALSRIYSPSDFGILATSSAVILTLGTIAGLRFELAIPLPARDCDAYGLAVLGLISATLVSILCSVAVLLGGEDFADRLGQADLMPWLWAVPPSVAVTGYYLVLNQLAIRQRRFLAIGRRGVLQSVTVIITQIGAGLAGIRPGGLVLGLGIGQAVSAASMLAGSGLTRRLAGENRGWANLRSLARRYRKFPLILGPSGLLNVLGLQLPILLLAAWYGGEVVGWMGLTQRVLAFPVTLIGTAVAQVYLAELARKARENLDSALLLFRRASYSLLAAGCVLLAVLWVFGPALFSFVFGKQWSNSGLYARALAIGLVAQLVASPLSQTLIVLERQRLQLLSDATRVVVIFFVVLMAKNAGASALTAVWAIGVVLFATYVLTWILSWRCLSTAAEAQRASGAPIRRANEPGAIL